MTRHECDISLRKLFTVQGSRGRNVAFGRAVPIGDAAYRRVPEVLRLAVKCPPELVSFDKVWCSHLLPLR